jgi:hypothetical protein
VSTPPTSPTPENPKESQQEQNRQTNAQQGPQQPLIPSFLTEISSIPDGEDINSLLDLCVRNPLALFRYWAAQFSYFENKSSYRCVNLPIHIISLLIIRYYNPVTPSTRTHSIGKYFAMVSPCPRQDISPTGYKILTIGCKVVLEDEYRRKRQFNDGEYVVIQLGQHSNSQHDTKYEYTLNGAIDCAYL